MLASGMTASAVCATLRISRTTLFEWRKSKDFQDEINAETIEFNRETRDLARQARDQAWKTLCKVLKSKNHAAAVRAASEVLRTLGVLRDPDKLVDASVKKFVVKFANLPGAKDE